MEREPNLPVPLQKTVNTTCDARLTPGVRWQIARRTWEP